MLAAAVLKDRKVALKLSLVHGKQRLVGCAPLMVQASVALPGTGAVLTCCALHLPPAAACQCQHLDLQAGGWH
jgi:hypothetical protein